MTSRQVGSLFVTLGVHDRATGSLGAFSSQLGSSERQAKSLARQTTELGVGLAKLSAPATAFFGFSTKAAIDFESAFAGVVKTVDASDTELQALRDTIRTMATDPSNPLAGLSNAHETIAGIMELGGQLGVPVGELENFASVIGQLGIATNLTTEEAAVMTAQFANITGMDFSNFDNFGSTIVDLGNNLATTERDIMEFAQRLAGVGSTVGLTEPQILALGGAMASVGLNAEAGGTSMTQVFNEMISAVAGGGAELDNFSRVAGVSGQDFADMWQGDPMVALTAFLTGLGDLDEAAQVQALDDLNLDGVRVADTLRRLSGNTDLLTDALGLANDAWDENNALSEEARKRLETTEAQFNVFKNTVKDVAISVGDILLPGFNKMLTLFQGLLVGVRETVDAFPGVVRVVARLATIVSFAAGALIGFGQVLSVIPILLSPMALAIGAVAAGVVILGELWNSNFLGIRESLKPVINALKLTFGWIEWFVGGVVNAFSGEGITGAIDFFKDNIGKLGDGLKMIWGTVNFNEVAQNLLDGLKGGWDALVAGGTWVKDNIVTPLVGKIVDAAGELAATDWEAVATSMLDKLKEGWSAIVTGGTWVSENLIQPLITRAGEVADSIDTHAVADGILRALGGAWNTIVSGGTWVLDNLITPIPQKAQEAVESVDWFGVGYGLVQAIGTAIGTYVDFSTWMVDNVFSPAATKGIEAVSSVEWGDVASGILNAIGTAITTTVNFVEWLNETVFGPMVAGALTALTEVEWGDVGSGILKAIGSAISTGVDLAQWLMDNVLIPLKDKAKTAVESIDWYNVGYDIISAIGSAIGAAFDFVQWIIDSIFQPTVDNAGAASEGTDWSAVGTTLINAIGTAIGAVWDVITWVGEVIILPMLQGMIDKIGETDWAQVGNTLFDALKTMIGVVWDAPGWIWENIVSPLLNGLVTKVTETDWAAFGTALLNSLGNAIGDMGQWAYDKIVKPIVDLVSSISISINMDSVDLGPLGSVSVPSGVSISTKAEGGPVVGGMPYLVGERGPELFVPSGNGNIVPNHALVGAGGGGTGGGKAVTINGNVYVQASNLEDLYEQLLRVGERKARRRG